jgi:hypothetical protein
LITRAYYLGLYTGLSAIADDGEVTDFIDRKVLVLLAETYFKRSGDDSFQSTPLGETFNELREEIRRLASTEDTTLDHARELVGPKLDFLMKQIRSIEHLTIEARRYLQSGLEALATELRVEDKESDLRKYQRLLDSLEDPVRDLALFQTDHDLRDRLEK